MSNSMLTFIVVSFFAGAIFGALISATIFKLKQKAQDVLTAANQMRELDALKAEIERWKNQVQLVKKESEIESNKALNQEKLSNQMIHQFESLANKILEEKSTRFADQNLKSLSGLLEPLKERIKDFEKKVEETYSSERSERGVLRGELNKLLELNQVMSQETQNLTKALKGESKTQGNWGEMILESILEGSGLRKGEEYVTQGGEMGLRSADGKVQLPDVIVNIPGGRHLVVDSKMTLTAYEAYASAENSEMQERHAKLHLKSLEDHITGLANKRYHANDKLVSPDFTLLFMPLEPAFALAFKLKPEIFQEAWSKNVAIVSPTTLLTTLRTVAALWKQERQQKNALEIAKRGGLLYDKFVGLLLDIKNLGEKLDSANKAHSDIVKKLSDGRGNLMSQVEELKDLGAKAEKSLPMIEN